MSESADNKIADAAEAVAAAEAVNAAAAATAATGEASEKISEAAVSAVAAANAGAALAAAEAAKVINETTGDVEWLKTHAAAAESFFQSQSQQVAKLTETQQVLMEGMTNLSTALQSLTRQQSEETPAQEILPVSSQSKESPEDRQDTAPKKKKRKFI